MSSIQDLLALGVYLTPAVKCGKTGYGIERATVVECSRLLEQEIALFPNVVAYLLLGYGAARVTVARMGSKANRQPRHNGTVQVVVTRTAGRRGSGRGAGRLGGRPGGVAGPVSAVGPA